MTTLDRLINQLARLPGIGKKSAGRIAYYLLKADPAYTEQLARDIGDLQTRITMCSICGNYTEEDPCDVCTNSSRDHSIICVVEQSQDIQTIESTNEYTGVFHVLGGVISPIDGIGPDQLTIDKLVSRVQSDRVTEVIIATNPTVEGDATAMYLVQLLAKSPVTVSRLASGLPVGGDLEYADRLTLARSLKGRVRLTSSG